MSRLEPIVTILQRRLRRGIFALIVLLGAAWAATLVMDYLAGQKRIRDLLAVQSISAAEASVYNQEALLVQRDLDRSLGAVEAVVDGAVAVTVSLDGAPVAQAGNLPADARWTDRYVTTSTLKNGQALEVVVLSSFEPLVQRLAVILALMAGAVALLVWLTSAGVSRVLARLVSPLADGIAKLEMLSRNLEDPGRIAATPWPDDACQEAGALREAIGRLATSLDSYQKNLAKSQSELIDAERRNATNEAIARTTQMLAHDVRKPFSILNMALNVLAKPELSPERFREFAASAKQSLSDALTQVNGLLSDVMEIGSTATPHLVTCSLEDLFAKATRLSFGEGPGPGVTIENRLTKDYELRVDEVKFLRVLVNILDNARQAVRSEGRIWYAAAREESGLTLVVGNSGPPIPADDLPRIFDAFYTKGKSGGTGLGLAIAKKVVEAHGGKVTCHSATDLGTEFRIKLPV